MCRRCSAHAATLSPRCILPFAGPSEPPQRGGHLVLITAADAQSVTFHNPSGDSPATRERVQLPLSRFAPFFAGRGIAIT